MIRVSALAKKKQFFSHLINEWTCDSTLVDAVGMVVAVKPVAGAVVAAEVAAAVVAVDDADAGDDVAVGDEVVDGEPLETAAPCTRGTQTACTQLLAWASWMMDLDVPYRQFA